MAGVHASPSRSIPLFLVYLATLMHTYSLATRHAAAAAAAEGEVATASASAGGLDAVVVEAHAGGAGTAVRRRRQQHLGESVSSVVTGWLSALGVAVVSAGAALHEFLLRACTVSERPPHYVLVSLRWRGRLAATPTAAPGASPGQREPAPGLEPGGGEAADGEVLRGKLQALLDGCRRADIAVARDRADARRARALGGVGAQLEEDEAPAGSSVAAEGPPLTFGGQGAGSAASPPSAQQQQAQQSLELAQPVGTGAGAPGPKTPPVDLSSMGPLNLRFHAFLPTPAASDGSGAADGAGGSSQRSESGRSSPGSDTADAAAARSGLPAPTVAALFKVVPQRSTPANSPGWCAIAGWPIRALNPARVAAATLVRCARDRGAGPMAKGTDDEGSGIEVLSAEPHSRQAQDWCAASLRYSCEFQHLPLACCPFLAGPADGPVSREVIFLAPQPNPNPPRYALTVLFDTLAFLYVALSFNRVVTSARSLSGGCRHRVVVAAPRVPCCYHCASYEITLLWGCHPPCDAARALPHGQPCCILPPVPPTPPPRTPRDHQ